MGNIIQNRGQTPGDDPADRGATPAYGQYKYNYATNKWELVDTSPGAPAGGGLPGTGSATPAATTPAATAPAAAAPAAGGGLAGGLATAGKALPWLQWAYGVWQGQQKGRYQNVPQSPQQAELYNWARGKVDALPDVNKALYPTAISKATASPSLDMDALRAGKPGAYTPPKQMPEGQLASILGGAPSSTPGGAPSTDEILKWYYQTFGAPPPPGGAAAPIQPQTAGG